MFEGEFASLKALYNTNIVRAPKPIKVRKPIVFSSPEPKAHR